VTKPLPINAPTSVDASNTNDVKLWRTTRAISLHNPGRRAEDFTVPIFALAVPPNMSDIEDEMDVDAPVVDDSITFGGDTKKGKRSAANLPVEAEDSLPWYVADGGSS
jgi:hypothetical protein